MQSAQLASLAQDSSRRLRTMAQSSHPNRMLRDRKNGVPESSINDVGKLAWASKRSEEPLWKLPQELRKCKGYLEGGWFGGAAFPGLAGNHRDFCTERGERVRVHPRLLKSR